MGRFAELPQALNLYFYAGNNPIILVDPTGEFMILIAPDVTANTPLSEAIEQSTNQEQTIKFGIQTEKNPQFTTGEKALILIMGGGGVAASTGSLIGTVKAVIKGAKESKETNIPSGFTKDDVPKNIRDQIPKEWGEGSISKNQKGWKWNDPNTPGAQVRYQQGNPKSPNPAQQQPYVKQSDGNGSFFDINGNTIQAPRPSEAPQGHIPADKFKFRNR